MDQSFGEEDCQTEEDTEHTNEDLNDLENKNKGSVPPSLVSLIIRIHSVSESHPKAHGLPLQEDRLLAVLLRGGRRGLQDRGWHLICRVGRSF